MIQGRDPGRRRSRVADGSEQDDRAPGRSLTLRERSQRRRSPNGKLGNKVGSRESEDVAVVTRIGDQQDHNIDSIITSLQRDPSRARLHVAQPRLSLHGHPPAAPLDHCVPGTSISRDIEWYLGPPEQHRWEQPSELGEEGKLRGIADRLALGERPERQIKPQRGGDENQSFERHVARLTELDPADLGRGKTDGISEFGEGQADLQPDLPKLLTDDDQGALGLSPGPVESSFPRDHARMVAGGALRPLTRTSRELSHRVGVCDQPRRSRGP
jgi:hypothetical protein